MWAEKSYLKFGNMSRLGKRPIEIPEKVEISQDGFTVKVKGPHGELSRVFRDDVDIALEDKAVTLSPKRNAQSAQALWGTYSSHIKNMIQGVSEPFVKKLVVEGVGFKVELSGSTLVLSVGFSHKVEVAIPEGLKVEVEKNVITISGIDKELVGQFTAKVRAYKKPEPYKGKGIRYEDEVVRRKQGKKTA